MKRLVCGIGKLIKALTMVCQEQCNYSRVRADEIAHRKNNFAEIFLNLG